MNLIRDTLSDPYALMFLSILIGFLMLGIWAVRESEKSYRKGKGYNCQHDSANKIEYC